ncbi:MAG: hypothetical protein K940chlam9_01906 [Chlamydiae bacterium]|nr:hypothetical protein [Chlamydiota bacterium]
MTIYSQHTLQLHQTNKGYSLGGKAFSSKKSIYNYLSCLFSAATKKMTLESGKKKWAKYFIAGIADPEERP